MKEGDVLLEVTVDLALGHFEALVLAERRDRHGLDLERERVVLALVEGSDLQVGRADCVLVESGVLEGFVAPLGDGVLESLAADEVRADVLDHEIDRDTALAEAGKLHLFADLGDGPVVGLHDRLSGDLDAELDLILACRVDLRLHCGFSVCRWNGPQAPPWHYGPPFCRAGVGAELVGAGERT